MATFFPVLFWGLAVLGALTGWGRLLGSKWKNTDHPAADWLEAPAWGIAISSLVGSLMNLLGLATRTGVVVFVLAGCALLAFSLITPLKNLMKSGHCYSISTDWKWLTVLALPLLALTLRFGSSVMIKSFYPDSARAQYIYFNPGDDAQSYLVSPERMLQTGSLGEDPFNGRQMMSGLGAQHFLNAMALAVFPPDNVHIIEGGVGLAAACLAAAGLGLRMQLGRTPVALLMFVPLIYRPGYINISSTTTTVAVLIALCSALAQLFEVNANLRRWLLTSGFLLGAACSLKSTAIPAAVILVVASAGLSALAKKSWRSLGLGLLTGLIGFAAMTPWMWWQYHSSGTALYPLLGRGFNVEVFFPSPSQPFHGTAVHELKVGLVLPLSVLVALLATWTIPTLREIIRRPVFCVTIAIVIGWVVSWPLIAISTEYDGVARYLMAARITALTMVLACGWRAGRQLIKQSGLRWAGWIGPALLVALFLAQWPELQMTYGQIIPADLTNSVSGKPYDWNDAAAVAHTAQAAVPANAKVLAYTDEPFLFDFMSSRIYVADFPGEASPPPGMPVHQGGEAVTSYLLGQGIRYVIYAYKTQAGCPRSAYGYLLDPAYGKVVNRTTVLCFAFQDDLAGMAKSYTHVYDDGYIYVLDLANHQPLKPTGR